MEMLQIRYLSSTYPLIPGCSWQICLPPVLPWVLFITKEKFGLSVATRLPTPMQWKVMTHSPIPGRLKHLSSHPRQWPSVWEMDGNIHVGGGSSGTIVKSSEFYDITSGTWTVSQDIPDNLYGSGSIRVGEKLYLIGGKNGSGYTNKLFSAYLPTPAANLYFKDGNATAEANLPPLVCQQRNHPRYAGQGTSGKDWAGFQSGH